MIKASGILRQVFAIGGETPGWKLVLDSELKVGRGTAVDEIEIDPDGQDLGRFANQPVRVTGTLVWRTGIERGAYPVLVVETIREAQ